MKITRKQLKMLIESIFIHGDSIPDRLGLQMKPDTKGIAYTALVLDEASRQKLMKFVPDGWTPHCHHMTLIAPTVQKGRRLPEYYLNQEATVTVRLIARDDKVIAGIIDPTLPGGPPGDSLPIDGPAFPHVTIATNPSTGGKPYMSNNLDPRRRIMYLGNPIILSGVIREL